jgi:MFS family permease
MQTFSALRHYNFRLYFIGLLISVIGTWAQTVAQQWLVYDLTGSALALGQVTFVMAIPVLIFGPWAGVVIDRVSQRNLLIITQVVQLLQAVALAMLTFSGLIQVWHIIVLSAVRGLANAFDAPARQSFYVQLVDSKEDMSNAIAMNSTLMSLAQILGPSLGGILVATLGTAWAFTINAISFFAILIALLLLRLKPHVRKPAIQSPLADLLEGLRYIWHTRTIAVLMVIVLAVALFGANYRTLMPVLTREVLGRGEVAFGLLNAASGVGSMIGALLVAYLSTRPRRGRYLNLVNLALPLMLIALALSRSYVLSLAILVLVGMSHTPQLSLSNMLIQSQIPDEVRGRVMSVYTLLIFGAFPIGGLIAGALADAVGTPLALAFSAGAVLLVSLGARAIMPQIQKLE